MAVQLSTLLAIQSIDPHRFTIDEYEKILKTGIFDDERVELLNGIITIMSPISDPHLGVVGRVVRLINKYRPDDYFCSPQSSLKIPNHGKPQPDIVIANPHEDDYVNKTLSAEDALLVIEVADSSLKRDREAKAPIYASAGIPEYWIINLQDHQIEVFKHPKGIDYQSKIIAKTGETVICKEIGFALSVDETFKGLDKLSFDAE